MKKLCLIGCGNIGSYHLSHLVQFKDFVELAGFCDLITEKAESFVEKAESGKAFSNFLEMYNEINPDMVFICVPPTQHGEIEFETIKRGIHFFVEKPLSLDVDLARNILAKVKENNIITASGFQCRYSNLVEPNIKFNKDNEIVYINCQRMGGIPDATWWVDKNTSGGQIVEQTIHQFDLIRYVFGEPTEVYTYGTRGFVKGIEKYNTDDLSVTAIKFASGALGTISTGCYATSGECFDCALTFSSKDKRCELRLLETLKIFGEEEEKADDECMVIKGDGGMHANSKDCITYTEVGDCGIDCDKTFIEAVISNDSSKIRSPYEDALKSLIFTLSCNKSMELGQPVKIEY